MAGRSEKITFTGSRGDRLDARLDLPEDTPKAWAVFAHCFTCSKDVFAVSRISRALAAEGVAVLRFDFTGLGSSEGEFANTDFSSNVGDLKAAAGWLAETHGGPDLLIGHSFGGAAVLAAAAELPAAKAVVTINAPCGPDHLVHLFTDAIETIRDEGEAEVSIGGRPFTIRRDFLDDIGEHALMATLGNLRKALLVFHAPRDQTVGIENAGRIFQAAKHPKSFVSLDDADHLLTRKEDALYVAAVIAAWAGRYLGAGAEEKPAVAGRAVPMGTVLVTENAFAPFGQDVTVGHHHLRADEPPTFGGQDTGPGPYDFLLAALGTCTGMTVRMYADRKQIPLEKVAVRLSHAKIHAEDCEDCDTERGKIDVIEREIELIGDLDDSTRTLLLEVADRCPVHRTLHSEIKVRSRLAAPGGTGDLGEAS